MYASLGLADAHVTRNKNYKVQSARYDCRKRIVHHVLFSFCRFFSSQNKIYMNPLRTMWYFRFEIFLKESQHKFT